MSGTMMVWACWESVLRVSTLFEMSLGHRRSGYVHVLRLFSEGYPTNNRDSASAGIRAHGYMGRFRIPGGILRVCATE
jgi:hypothetical protein